MRVQLLGTVVLLCSCGLGVYSQGGQLVDAGAPARDSGLALADDAAIDAFDFPTQLAVGQGAVATVTVKNVGTSTWTRALGYRLGAVGDADPLSRSTRFELDAAEAILPGGTRTFSIPLTGLAPAGAVLSDWQMVREGVAWFGAVATASVLVTQPSSAKAITRFTVLGVDAAISGNAITLTLPAGTDATRLTPTVEFTGASLSPASGLEQDLSRPASYLVTAADGSTETWSVAVTVAPTVTPNGDDALDLSTVQVFNSPADVASWPITTHLTQLTMQSPDVGLSFSFSALATWPDYTPPGWTGPLQYTVWAVVDVGGTWYTSGYIQMWNGRASTGAPILSDFAINWAYDGRWGPMMGHQPVVGELMGFFVTAGNARGVSDVTSLRERSNVVLVHLPAGDNGVFTF